MVEVSAVLPCMNEAPTIGVCVEKINSVFASKNIFGEIIVVDNASEDSSIEIAVKAGAKVLNCPIIGYGGACLEGIQNSSGKIIVVCDSDNTYDLNETPKLLDELAKGNDIIVGSRFLGKMEKGAMKPLHRYIGNPLLTFIFNILFGTNYTDSHSGFRVIKRGALKKLNLRDKKFNLTLEMLIEAKRKGLKVKEIPINYYARISPSKLNSFRDGSRHLLFMLTERFK